MRNEAMSQVIRYEQELKQKIQAIDNRILQGSRTEAQMRQINDLMQEEEILMKYLEVESSKLAVEVRNIYNKNLLRFRKKIKQHKEYFYAFFGVAPQNPHTYNVSNALEIQRQNNELFNQRLKMYQNERIHGTIGHNVQQQGEMLQRGIEANRTIRNQADNATDAIKLIQASILRRKMMFYSIFGFFIIGVLFVICKKLFK